MSFGVVMSMYHPREITGRAFPFKNETVAKLSATEREMVRIDERIKHSLAASPVRTTLLRADALSTVNINKVYPDIYTVMRIEAAGHLLNKIEDTNDTIKELLADENHPTMDLSLLVYRSMQAIKWVSDPKSDMKILTPDDMCALYGRSLVGPHYHDALPEFRKESFGKPEDDRIFTIYKPPSPDELGPLLDDFCTFLNQDTLSPMSQASIVQFQFEALRPFDDNLDRIERLLMHYVFRRRRFLENLILPINLFSAHFKNRFYDLLKPNYEKDEEGNSTVLYAEELVLNTAQVVHDLLGFTLTLHKTILSLIDSWKSRLGRLQKGSTIELLLFELVGRPVMTITQGSELVRRSFSATSDAFTRLEQVGIVRAGNPIRRNTTFEAPDAMRLHDVMYKRKSITYTDFADKNEATSPVKIAQTPVL